jgi:hypothetical protein
LFKRNSGELKKLLKQIETIALKIQSLNLDFDFNFLLPCGRPELVKFWELPDTINNYVKFMKHIAQHFGKGTEGMFNLAKARLTAYVKARTGHFHDAEVAALVGAVMANDYCETDHRKWLKWNRLLPGAIFVHLSIARRDQESRTCVPKSGRSPIRNDRSSHG